MGCAKEVCFCNNSPLVQVVGTECYDFMFKKWLVNLLAGHQQIMILLQRVLQISGTSYLFPTSHPLCCPNCYGT